MVCLKTNTPHFWGSVLVCFVVITCLESTALATKYDFQTDIQDGAVALSPWDALVHARPNANIVTQFASKVLTHIAQTTTHVSTGAPGEESPSPYNPSNPGLPSITDYPSMMGPSSASASSSPSSSSSSSPSSSLETSLPSSSSAGLSNTGLNAGAGRTQMSSGALGFSRSSSSSSSSSAAAFFPGEGPRDTPSPECDATGPRHPCASLNEGSPPRDMCEAAGCCWSDESNLGDGSNGRHKCYSKTPTTQEETVISSSPTTVPGAVRPCVPDTPGLCMNMGTHMCTKPVVPTKCPMDGNHVMCCPEGAQIIEKSAASPEVQAVAASDPNQAGVRDSTVREDFDDEAKEEMDPDSQVSDDGELCGSYARSTVQTMVGNRDIVHKVVRVLDQHFTGSADNTMTLATACAFDKLATAAAERGVTITISSAFRTYERQQYFWQKYSCSRATGRTVCSNGPLAAVPGTSNHGIGTALDLSTNCGRQSRSSAGPPSKCLTSSRVYMFLREQAHVYGFRRTVRSEPWHWEFMGANPGAPSWQ